MLVYYSNIEMQKLLTIYAIAFTKFQNISKHVINQRYIIKNGLRKKIIYQNIIHCLFTSTDFSLISKSG